MKLTNLLAHLPDAQVQGSTNIEISNVAYDSRKVEPGGLFVATKGFHVDGHQFIPQAIERGAVAIVYDSPEAVSLGAEHKQSVALVQVANSRAALSPVAAAFYGQPAHQLTVVGVTGSKGKTTTSTLLAHVLDQDSHSSGLMTTMDFKIGPRWWDNKTRQTTLESLDVQRMLRDMVDAGCDMAVVETSSHALSAQWNRVGDCAFDTGVITNITHEHLDYHGTFEQYRSDKARLFELVQSSGKPQRTAIINLDDANAQFFIDAAGDSRIITYAVQNQAAQVHPRDVELTRDGVKYTALTPWGDIEIALGIPGEFNVLNSLAALTVGLVHGISKESCAVALRSISGVKGRMERVEAGQPFTVVVDYAHNPDSFEQVMGMLRPLTQGQLISVFGSGGERDHDKRPMQGQIAGRMCDLVILADEDPRDEDPLAILEAIAAGVQQAGKAEGKDYFVIADRAQAIRAALQRAQPGDIVLLLGKGHESNILYEQGRTMPWNEHAEAEKALGELGFRT